jgi:predicted transcriptional regulator of viral defense system
MTVLQKEFLDLLDEYGFDVFDIKMLKTTNRFKDPEIYQALRTLTKSGVLIKLERGKYRRVNFTDSFVIGNFLAADGGIAYWSALNYHGLTEQFVNVVYVQTSKRTSEEVVINSLRYKFVKVAKRKLAGYIKKGYGNHEYKITNVEKTIVDCFDLPHHAGWYQEIIKAFNKAPINQNNLIKYCKIINNIAVIKRLAFLAELLQKQRMDKFIDFAKNTINNDYTLFEIDNEKRGEYNSKWKLIINMSRSEILEIANS